MFNLDVKVSENDDMSKLVEQALKKLENTQVLVGIPEENDGRDSGVISNASLMYIHSNGSPLQGIPARPVIEPAIEHYQERIGNEMQTAVDKAMEGNIPDMMVALERAGMDGQNVAKGWFTNPSNGWPPLAEATQKQKAKKGSDPARPLIDTGELRNSITYVIREGGAGH